MNLKNQFKKADIENYQNKITKLENQINSLMIRKKMYEIRLKEKERELQ